MALTDLIEQLGSRKPSASDQEVWASLVEHFKTSGGDIELPTLEVFYGIIKKLNLRHTLRLLFRIGVNTFYP